MRTKKRVIGFLSPDGKSGLIDPDGRNTFYPELAHGTGFDGPGADHARYLDLTAAEDAAY